MASLDDDDERAITIATFRWLLSAREPLSVENFRAAITSTVYNDDSTTSGTYKVIDSCDPDQNMLSAEHILHNTFNLVVEGTDPSTFVFPHLSVREHLETMAEYSDVSQNHAITALVCLKVLYTVAEEARRENPKLPHVWAMDGIQRDKYCERLWKTHGRNFPGYAILHWAYHCQACPNQRQCQGSTLATLFGALFRCLPVTGATREFVLLNDSYYVNNSASHTFILWNSIFSAGAVIALQHSHALAKLVCSGPNPAFTACALGFYEIVKPAIRLLENSGKLAPRSSEGALWAARNVGGSSLLEVILEAGVVLDLNLNEGYGTLLHAGHQNKNKGGQNESWCSSKFISVLETLGAIEETGELCPCPRCEFLRSRKRRGLPFKGSDSDGWNLLKENTESNAISSKQGLSGNSSSSMHRSLRLSSD